ncbi:hypothetical protein GCM10017688_31250 [Streptomyces ramulosus]
MDGSWWPALVAVIALALVAAVVDGRGRSRRPPRRRGRRAGAAGRPAERPGPGAGPGKPSATGSAPGDGDRTAVRDDSEADGRSGGG